MKVGSIVYATDQGLGRLAKSFYDAGIVTDVCIHEHHSRPNHFDWYPECTPVMRRPNGYNVAHEFVKSMDVMLFFETPFDWTLFTTCKQNGVKTVFMPMYECTLQSMPAQPDKWICPSLLDYQYFPKTSMRDSVHIPVPVDVPWRLRETAHTFVHNAGHGGLKGRNGTAELMLAMQYVKSPLRLIVRTQEDFSFSTDDPRIDLRVGTADYATLWDEGDVFVFPEKFNGLSLPLQEAYASGMFVMATDRMPNNKYLPIFPLIPATRFVTNQVGPGYLQFEEAVHDPRIIASCMDLMYRQPIEVYSETGRVYARENSWEVLKPRYLETLQ